MSASDKSGFQFLHQRDRAALRQLLGAALSLATLAGCDRMITSQSAQTLKDADTKSAQGNFIQAIGLYETALDGTAQTAEVHYKLGLLYDDKMNDPLNALHHYKRYLVLQPTGSHAAEVKDFIKRDETAFLTNLSGDSVVTRAEAARLRNENLSLRKQIEERVKPRGIEEKPAPHAEKATATKAGNQTYTVESGDTLFSIARKFYKSSARWKEIRDANKSRIDNPGKLKPGQTLVIP
jgi:LysM repeat protein